MIGVCEQPHASKTTALPAIQHELHTQINWAGWTITTYSLAQVLAMPVAGRLNDVKFKRMIRPGDTILIEAVLDDRMGDAFFLSAKVTCEGKAAVTLNFAVALAKREVNP